MRQRNWACCKNKWLLLSRFITGLLAVWLCMPCLVIAQSVTVLGNAEYAISDSSALPEAGTSWHEVTLPHRSARPADQALTGYWYRLGFHAEDDTQPLWLLFPKLRSGGTVYLNGLMIGRIGEADLQTQRRWFRPYRFVAPPVALRTGHNEILVRFAIREPLTSFGQVLLGPEREIRSIYDRLFF